MSILSLTAIAGTSIYIRQLISQSTKNNVFSGAAILLKVSVITLILINYLSINSEALSNFSSDALKYVDYISNLTSSFTHLSRFILSAQSTTKLRLASIISLLEELPQHIRTVGFFGIAVKNSFFSTHDWAAHTLFLLLAWRLKGLSASTTMYDFSFGLMTIPMLSRNMSRGYWLNCVSGILILNFMIQKLIEFKQTKKVLDDIEFDLEHYIRRGVFVFMIIAWVLVAYKTAPDTSQIIDLFFIQRLYSIFDNNFIDLIQIIQPVWKRHKLLSTIFSITNTVTLFATMDVTKTQQLHWVLQYLWKYNIELLALLLVDTYIMHNIDTLSLSMFS